MKNQINDAKFDYKWVIVAICFLMIFVTLGFCSSNASLYTFAITETLGISRSAYSLNGTARFVSTSLINIFFGTLIAKFGPKKLICAGFICLIATMIIYSVATNVFVFYLGGALLGIGMSWCGTTMVSSIINRWVTENKGTVMGVVLAANGLGGALAAQIVSPIIYDEQNAFGYRNAYRLVAVILAATLVLVLIFFKDKPKGSNGNNFVVHKKKSRARDWIGIEYSKAQKLSFFIPTLICIFLTGFVLHGIGGVASVHQKDVGMSTGYIATVASVHSIALTLFKFLTGFIYDKKGLRFTMTVCSVAAIVSMICLSLQANTLVGKILAMIYGVVSSLSLPLETIMLPIYAGDLFGQKSFDKVLGVFVSVNTAGYALGSPAMNLVYDIFGDYKYGLIACAILMTVVLITMQFIITAANRMRKKVITEAEQQKINGEVTV